MCGICGTVTLHGDSSEASLLRMMPTLAHRGPDDLGTLTLKGASLGHRRLSIIDLDGGRQPLGNEDGTIWVVFNGEIYNFESLRADLARRGHRFRTRSDTEVLVHLYEEHGTDCVRHLRGMFAFVLWDSRNSRLFAARDHLGQKPFFYALREDEFLFASEIKALLAADPSLAVLDLEALDQYLALRIIAPPLTMFRGIRKLPPAHHLCFDADGLRLTRYWDLHYGPKHKGSERDLIAALEEQVLESLRLHLVSDVPVGAFMSGGLDSTLLVAMLMKNGLSPELQTFSMGIPHGRFDEAPFARMVAQRYGTRHTERTEVPSLLEHLPRLIWHLDEPSDALALCAYRIARMARDQVKVVIGGDGGDELFGGYDRYYGNLYAGRYAHVPGGIRRRLLGPLIDRVPEGDWYKSAGHQIRWMHHLSFLEGGERYARSLSYFYFHPALRAPLHGPRMREKRAGFDPEGPIRRAYEEADAGDPIDRMLRADSCIRLPDHSVFILDRMTMAHGLEARSPFLDPVLAQFAARLPRAMKVRGRTLRYIQARLAERYLPEEVRRRPKQGFSSALPYLLKGEMAILFGAFLRDSHLVRQEVLEASPIESLLEAHLAGSADHGNRLWLLLNSEIWYRMRIEGESVGAMDELIARAARATGGLKGTAAESGGRAAVVGGARS